jgi:Ca2+-dependent lipid-binding protein
MASPNEMHRRTDALMGFEDADDMSGKLHWSIGYFEKAPLKKELERGLTEEEQKQQPAQPSKTAPEMEMLPNDAAPNPAKKDLPPPPPDILKTRPDPEFPSGVLNVTIHHAINVERQNLKGRKGEREGEAGQDTDNPSEQNDNLPSAYCEVIVNDDLVFKTRVKQYSTNPFWEAPMEVFCRDFRDTVIRIVVRDSRLRENDPILGVISLRAAEIFSEASSVTST